MCLTVVGLSVARGVCRGGEEGEERERGSWPYGGDGHNVAAATQGASPLYSLATHNAAAAAAADITFKWCFQTRLVSLLDN